MTSKFYAVANGHQPGIYDTWEQCAAQVLHYSKAKFKKFKTREEAEHFIRENTLTAEDPPVDNYVTEKKIVVGKRIRAAGTDKEPQAKKQRKTYKYIVFCDGNADRNGQANSKAGSGVFCAHPDIANEGSGVPGKQTNSRAELFAAALALKKTEKMNSVLIKSDSSMVVTGLKEWLETWKCTGWRRANNKPVLNSDLWKLIDRLLSERQSAGMEPVRFEKVKAHSGLFGNEKADSLASAGKSEPEPTAEQLEAVFGFKHDFLFQ